MMSLTVESVISVVLDSFNSSKSLTMAAIRLPLKCWLQTATQPRHVYIDLGSWRQVSLDLGALQPPNAPPGRFRLIYTDLTTGPARIQSHQIRSPSNGHKAEEAEKLHTSPRCYHCNRTRRALGTPGLQSIWSEKNTYCPPRIAPHRWRRARLTFRRKRHISPAGFLRSRA